MNQKSLDKQFRLRNEFLIVMIDTKELILSYFQVHE
jgi:hypothetical protein